MQEDMKMLVAIFVLLVNTVLGQQQQQSSKPCAQQTHMCFLDPCLLASCPKYPQANCRNYKCGSTCIAEFWYNGQEVTSQCASNAGKDLLTSIFSSGSKPSGGTSNTVTGGTTPATTSNNGCPNGQDRVNCFLQPCSVSSCPGVPGATCRDNYCGSCKAEYFLGQQEVTSQCPQQPGSTVVTSPQVNNNACPNGQQMSNCAVRPCAINSCSRFPTATCRDNYCGGCNAQFFLGQQEVTSQCSPPTAVTGVPQINPAAGPSQDPSTGNCPPNQVMRCNFSPCRVSSCVNYPNAVCTDVNCGGCYAKFYYNGQEVTSLCRQQQQPPTRRFPPWYYFLFGDVF